MQCVLRISEVILLLREESYIPHVDAGVKTELMDCYYYTICTCQICCNRDHWCWLVRIACQRIVNVQNCPR